MSAEQKDSKPRESQSIAAPAAAPSDGTNAAATNLHVESAAAIAGDNGAAAGVEIAAGAAPADPGAAQVLNYLLYGLSLPERTLRSTSAVVGGALRESADMLTPQAFRSSKSYSMFVQQMLDFVVEDVGGVERKNAAGQAQVESFVAKKAVSGFIELAGAATLPVSPLTVLALISDMAYGSQAYLKELSAELKKHGIIDEQSTIDSAADLLAAIGNTSGKTGEALDLPPLTVQEMKQTIEQTRAALNGIDPARLIPQAELNRLWTDMHEVANREGVSVFDVSSTMALYAIGHAGAASRGAVTSVTVAGNMFDRHILDHYRGAIGEIQRKGMYATLAESSAPYIGAMWSNFSAEKETITEDLLSGKMLGRAVSGVQSWFSGKSAKAPGAEGEPPPNDGSG